MTAPQRNDAYAIAMSPAEPDRLVAIAHDNDPFVRDGFRRTDLGLGDAVIDVGCGPLGGLLALSDIVGPQGVVVGLDMDAPSLGRAREILDQQRRAQVQLVHGNINELDRAALCPPGPFDAAFCRLFLNHQTDPAATLRRIAAIVRPGGYIVIHELLPVSPPSIPDVPAINAAIALWKRAEQARGASAYSATQLSAICAAAGLSEVDQHGFFANRARNPTAAFGLLRATTVGFRSAIIETGTATGAEIDALLAELKAAERQRYDVLILGTIMELVAQVPQPSA